MVVKPPCSPASDQYAAWKAIYSTLDLDVSVREPEKDKTQVKEDVSQAAEVKCRGCGAMCMCVRDFF